MRVACLAMLLCLWAVVGVESKSFQGGVVLESRVVRQVMMQGGKAKGKTDEEDADAEPEAEGEPEPYPEAEAEAEPYPEAEAEAEAEAEPYPEAEAEAEPYPEAEAEPEPYPEAKAEPKPAAKGSKAITTSLGTRSFVDEEFSFNPTNCFFSVQMYELIVHGNIVEAISTKLHHGIENSEFYS
nr:procyclic form-specific polypeptide B-alpha-like [Penaeus vannamei]